MFWLFTGRIGDKIIAIGGVGDNQQPVDAIECYNIKDKKWTELDKLPKGRLGISSVLRGLSPKECFTELRLFYLNYPKFELISLYFT